MQMEMVRCPVCEAAKAELMRLLGCDEPAAHRRLQQVAMNWRMRKVALAEAILALCEGRPRPLMTADLLTELLTGCRATNGTG